jgi:hypothetical protein
MHREKNASQRKPESVVDEKFDHDGFLHPPLAGSTSRAGVSNCSALFK